MKASDQFENTIIAVFGKEFFEEIHTLYLRVKQNAGQECDSYGGDSSTIALMLRIRAAMREKNLAPSELPDFRDLEGFYKSRTELLRDTTLFQQLFPKTWEFDCEIQNPNQSYKDDGWRYELSDAIKEMREADKNIEWIFQVTKTKRLVHYYYNELDHYLTYLVGAIRKSAHANDSSYECGLKALRIDIEELLKKPSSEG